MLAFEGNGPFLLHGENYPLIILFFLYLLIFQCLSGSQLSSNASRETVYADLPNHESCTQTPCCACSVALGTGSCMVTHLAQHGVSCRVLYPVHEDFFGGMPTMIGKAWLLRTVHGHRQGHPLSLIFIVIMWHCLGCIYPFLNFLNFVLIQPLRTLSQMNN